MALDLTRVILISLVGFVFVDAWTGNVCSRVRTRSVRVRYCRMATWRACCYWGYRWKTVYTIQYYCCPGWRTRSWGSQDCSQAICYPSCRNGGKCVAPNKCDCAYPFTGQICTGVLCSHLKPCYPGVCDQFAECTCDPEFGGTDCTSITSPLEIPHIDRSTCLLRFYDRENEMNIYEYMTDATKLDEKDILWANQDRFNQLTFVMESVYMPPDNISATPPYVSQSTLGIVSGEVFLEHTKISTEVNIERTVPINDTHPCNGSLGSQENPNTEIYTCNLTTEYLISFESGDWLTVTFKTKNGGIRKMVDPKTDVHKKTDYYVGKETTKTVEFRFDYTSPFHCAENGIETCPTESVPLAVAKDITRKPIRSWWTGWEDNLSGIFRYSWEIFKLQPDETGTLYEPHDDEKGPQPLVNRAKNHSDGNFQQEYTPSQAGMYSIVLEASDLANNSKYARRLVLFDPDSFITLNSEKDSRLHVTSATDVQDSNYQWQAHVEDSQLEIINVSWANHFANKVHEDGNLLNGVKKYPELRFDKNMLGSKHVTKSLDDNEGNRTVDPIPNVHGIIKFEVAYTDESFDTVPSQYWIHIGINEFYQFKKPVKGGDAVKIWVRAHDIVGNEKIDSTVVHFDNDPPVVSESPSLIKKTNGTYPFTTSLNFEAFDPESGIWKFDYRFENQNKSETLKEGSFPTHPQPQSERKQFCDQKPRTCYCTAFGCFDYAYQLDIDNCWLVLPKEELGTQNVILYVDVISFIAKKQSFYLEITELQKYEGLGDYYGPMHVEVEKITETSAQVNWHQSPTCYKRTGIKFVLRSMDNKVLNEEIIHKDAVTTNIIGLVRKTEYLFDLYTMYDSEISDNVTITFTTIDEGLSGGAVAGIVIGLLLLILFIVLLIFFLWRTGRLTACTGKRDVERAKPTFAAAKTFSFKNIKAKFQHSNRGYDNNAYAGTNKHTVFDGDDDLYIVREEMFNEHPTWLLSREEVTFESLLTSGRFANIYKAIAYHGSKKQETVVAKTLKENPSEEDIQLMKAKIGFYAEEVGNHPNILQFIGAIGDDSSVGPFIILEYCETGTLQEYLQANRNNVTTDLQDRLFRFSFDTAKGMEYLASRKIVHRRLAARNILLTYICDIKISGFGPKVAQLEGQVEDESSKKERIPIKWMCPESIENPNSYSEKSDVWSYGIVLWEIFSLGETPYKGTKSSDLLSRLKHGYRMEKPEQCDEFYYKLMKKCWNEKPGCRPNFSKIRGEIEPMFVTDNSEDYYYYRK